MVKNVKVPFPFRGNEYGMKDLGNLLQILQGDYGSKWKPVNEFENAFADYVGSKYAVACSSGTTALHLALKSLDLKPGDEVITSPLTWVATSNMILLEGAKPVFVDIDPDTLNLDPGLIKERVTNRTKAIMPVYLAGNPAPLEDIAAIAQDNNLKVVADAAQAVGAKYRESRIGSGNLEDLACFSFHTQKNMSTLGEGGMITSNNPDFVKTMRLYANHGIEYSDMKGEVNKQPWYRDCVVVGYNYRMSEGQAIVGLSQLAQIDAVNSKRRHMASLYNNYLRDVSGLRLPVETSSAQSSWHLYIIHVEEEFGMSRDDLHLKLKGEGIGTSVHYTPVYFFKPYQELGYKKGICTNAEKVYDRILSLPLAPCMEDSDIYAVIRAIKDAKG